MSNDALKAMYPKGAVVSICARCGRTAGDGKGECYVSVAGDECEGALLPATVECREAELANLRSLFRSVTGKLEEARANLEDINDPAAALSARLLIDTVLEVLS